MDLYSNCVEFVFSTANVVCIEFVQVGHKSGTVDKNDEAGGGGTNIKSATNKFGIHNSKRTCDEMKAKCEKQEEELTEVKGKHNMMVACVVLHAM